MVIGTINVNDNNKKQSEIKRDDLLYAQRKKENYELNDFVIVRTTSYLDSDYIIKPLFHVPFIVKNNHIILHAIQDIMDEKEHIDFYQDMERYQARSEMIKSTFLPYSSQYRSTVHFAINGLVSSHSKGNFDNRDFIIIDSLSYHLQNNDIRAFRMEDTYMYGDVKLSPNTVIMVKQEKYEDLLLQNPQLNQYNIVLYTGDEKDAVDIYLTSIGIISEKIGEHGASEHSCSTQIYKFRDKLKETYGIDSEPHWLSKEYREDDENSLIIWDYYNNLFYSFLLNKLEVKEPEFSFRLQDLMDARKEEENVEYIKQIVSKIGLDQFKNIVTSFNMTILDSITNGTFKNNDQIISELKSNQK